MNFIKFSFILQLFFFLIISLCIPIPYSYAGAEITAYEIQSSDLQSNSLEYRISKAETVLYTDGKLLLFCRDNFFELNLDYSPDNLPDDEKMIIPVDTLLNISTDNDNGNAILHFFLAADSPGSDDRFFYRKGEDNEWHFLPFNTVVELESLIPATPRLFIGVLSKEAQVVPIYTINFDADKPAFLVRFWWIFLIPSLLLIFIIFKRYRQISPAGIKAQTVRVEAFHRQEPSHVEVQAPEREGGVQTKNRKTKWDKYSMVTVLFSDIQGFTKIAEEMNPEVLVDELDKFFFHFDSVVEKYHIEKIKTIGDAYMAAGGIPQKNRSNPMEVALAAIEMQYYMQQLKKTKVDFWDLRIGIHTGPVIAGVIGHKKRSYDIWGDTVNTASRMESSGLPGKVNISGETYNLIKDYFICEYRGRIPVKYKGNLDMYLIVGLRPELSMNLGGLPNRKFFLKLQILRLADLEEHVFQKLKEEVPENYHFHNLSHAQHLYSYSELLCKAENLDTEETLLIRTAILLFPLGYIMDYNRPELEASKLCEKVLPDFRYSDKQIQSISNLILASQWPPEPSNLLEKIMVDTRYEYLGRADFKETSKLLLDEALLYGRVRDKSAWLKQQIKFLRDFRYYTTGAQRLSELSGKDQIERLVGKNG